MINIKDIMEALNKMANIKLNIAIFMVCTILVYFSPADQFILAPFPISICQALIFVTSIRIVFALIIFINDIIKAKVDASLNQRAARELAEKQKIEREQNRKMICHHLEGLDIFQMQIIKALLATNCILMPKSPVLFSLKNMKLIYAVSTGPTHEGMSLDPIAKDVILKELNDKMNNLERNIIEKFFRLLPKHEFIHFTGFEKNISIITGYDRHNNVRYSPENATFSHYSDTILFEQPIRRTAYILTDNARNALELVMSKAQD
ncbi:hypothetical protein RM407_003823 [Enterobacter kobei]|nr:hypothetical protein [Enterobacter kobei]